MDGPSERGGGRARSGRGRGDTSHQANGASTGPRGRTPVNNGPPRELFSGATLQKAIARGLAVGDANVRDPKRGPDLVDLIRNASGRSRAGKDSQLDKLIVRGLKQSRAATNPDGGLKDLLAFLERKASGADPKREPIRIRKVCSSSTPTSARGHHHPTANARLLRSALVSSQSSERRPTRLPTFPSPIALVGG